MKKLTITEIKEKFSIYYKDGKALANLNAAIIYINKQKEIKYCLKNVNEKLDTDFVNGNMLEYIDVLNMLKENQNKKSTIFYNAIFDAINKMIDDVSARNKNLCGGTWRAGGVAIPIIYIDKKRYTLNKWGGSFFYKCWEVLEKEKASVERYNLKPITRKDICSKDTRILNNAYYNEIIGFKLVESGLLL